MTVSVISLEGLDGSHAVIRTKHTRDDAVGFCRDYVGKVTPTCISEELAIPLNDTISANCKKGEFVNFSGERFRFEGPVRKKSDETMAEYILRNLALANGRYVIVPLREQHLLFVETIKRNRIKNSLDRIRANKGKLTYECVWGQSDNKGPWLCIFALNIYNWKDLGKMPFNPARGCAGCYVMQSGSVPATATQVSFSRILIPSTNPFDPFGG